MSEERLQMIEDMLKKNPEDAFLNYAAALEYRKRGMLSEAVKLFEGLIENHEYYLGTYYQLGKMMEEMGETDKAIALYRKGKTIAESQKDMKTMGELNEALLILDDDDDEDW